MNILTVNYNNPRLTEVCIKSILKFTPSPEVTVFDNSDKTPLFQTCLPGVTVLDNTRGQIIDFSSLGWSPSREWTGRLGSAKHCYTIDYCLSNYFREKPVLLVDPDMIFKADLSGIPRDTHYWGGLLRQSNINIL